MMDTNTFSSHTKFIKTPDDIWIRYGCWPCQEKKIGILVLLNGRSEFLEKYKEPIAILNRKGFDVFSLDWRGQGLSSRLLPNPHKGHVKSFDDYLIDLKTVLAEIVLPRADKPLFFLGHSMGGHIGLRYLLEKSEEMIGQSAFSGKKISGAVFSSPMIDIQTAPLPGGLVKSLSKIFVKAGCGNVYALGNRDYDTKKQVYEGNDLTSDPVRYQDHVEAVKENHKLAIGGVTYGWLMAAYESIEILKIAIDATPNVYPMIIAGAQEDTIVSVQAQKALCKNMPNCKFILIKQAKHEILKERDPIQNQFWTAFDRFVEKYISEQ